jgi:DNA-binding FadR family transcriptional regulator
MNKKQKVAIAALLVFSIIGAGLTSAFSMGFGGFNKDLTAEELKTLTEENQQMTQAIENGDYNTWKALMEKRIDRMKSELTEENFNQVVERYNQMKERSQLKQQINEALQSGDYETAAQLRKQLGSSGGFGPRGGFDGQRMPW